MLNSAIHGWSPTLFYSSKLSVTWRCFYPVFNTYIYFTRRLYYLEQHKTHQIFAASEWEFAMNLVISGDWDSEILPYAQKGEQLTLRM